MIICHYPNYKYEMEKRDMGDGCELPLYYDWRVKKNKMYYCKMQFDRKKG